MLRITSILILVLTLLSTTACEERGSKLATACYNESDFEACAELCDDYDQDLACEKGFELLMDDL